MHKGDTIPGLLFALLGAFCLCVTYTSPMLKFGSNTSDGVPGAGFFPSIMGSVLLIFGLALMVRGIRQHGTVTYMNITPEIKGNLKVLGLMVVGVALYLAIWKITEQFLVSLVLFALYENVVLRRSKVFTIVFTVIMTVFVWALFMKGFKVSFRV